MSDRREEAQVLVTASLVSELITEVRSLTAGITDLAEHLAVEVSAARDAAEATRAIAQATRRSRRRDLAMTGALVVVMLCVLGVGLVNWRNGREVRRINRQVIECTTPSSSGDRHECFEDGQARTAAVVDRVAVAVADEVERRSTTTTTVP